VGLTWYSMYALHHHRKLLAGLTFLDTRQCLTMSRLLLDIVYDGAGSLLDIVYEGAGSLLDNV